MAQAGSKEARLFQAPVKSRKDRMAPPSFEIDDERADDGSGSGEGRGRHARVLALWAPDISLVLAIVTLVYCLFFFDGWQKLFRDSDTGWHIRTGESILTMRALPATDPYSFTRAGEPWLDWEWGADVASALAYRISGLAGVAALFALAISMCTWLWFKLHFTAGGDLLLACAMAAPMLSTMSLHWLARPHVFGWVLLLVFVLALEKVKGLSWQGAAGFALLGMVWANLHGSFVLGIAIGLLYALGAFIEPALWADARDQRRFRSYLAAVAGFAAGTFVNPYGASLHLHVARYLTDWELLSRVGEFQSFNFHVPGSGQILLMLGIASLGAAASLGARRPEHFLVTMFLLAAAIRSARALPIAALIALPYAGGAIRTVLLKARGLAPNAGRALQSFFDYSARLRSLDRGLSGVALVPILLILLFAMTLSPAIAARAGFPADEFPVAASAAVAGLPAKARILAPDKFGGYLIYRFNGSRKVYFDGRSDFYGAAFMKRYISLIEVRPGWRQQVAALGFTHALLPGNYSLIPALEQAGWRTVHKDATATLLAAPGH